MSDFDPFQNEQTLTLEEEQPESSGGGGSPDTLFNVLTLVFLLGTVAVIGIVVVLFALPGQRVALNLGDTEPTATLICFPEIQDCPGEPTSTPAPDATLTPTIMTTLTPTPTSVLGATEGPETSFAFVVPDEAITYQSHEGDEGCDWASIAGSAVDTQGNAITDTYSVEVVGEEFEQLAFTGTAPDFGASGWEIQLGGEPINGTYTVQLLDATGEPLSAPIEVSTRGTCAQNVTVVTFQQASDS